MPVTAPRPCAAPACRALVRGGRFCADHVSRGAAARALGGRGTSHERGYDARWRKARAAFLAAHPLCAECQRHGRVTPARVVDHIKPHRGDEALFWNEANWQALCDFTSPFDCHGAKTGRGE
ncbi:MAG: HNH endonuclease [Archangium gephyra]|uniref:HNH endonuclease n=1 Tax=Archangium gephyra TaxID=48 RepID=A0A2W5SZC8_9BACT|nr:MAG: HNH endonuclease [Archangium gephyra]